jgi:hypothetical protein
MMAETGTRSEWLAANGEFLAASLAWLRELLRQHAQARQQAPARTGALAAAVEEAAARCLPPPALVTLPSGPA